jgi:integrase
MPRQSRGARLWLRPARRSGGRAESPVWLIRDGGRQFSTGCGESERAEAERRLAAHIKAKYSPARRERHISEIPVADVINVYLADVVPGQARPEKAAERAERLLDFFGEKTLDEINGAVCRQYQTSREGKGRANKGTGGGARRDLQDFAAAINHHAREGFHREVVRVVLPPRGRARQRWLTRDEFARLLWICWRTREVQEGVETDKRPLRHLCRFLLLGVYTGSRPGAILRASWVRGPGLSRIDTANGVFHRHAEGARETNKRQPTVRLAPGLLSHLRRWERIDAAKTPPQVHAITFNGQPIASVKTAMASACSLAKLSGNVTAYTLRHTAGSWLVARGISSRKGADFIGTSEKIFVETYGHLAPDYQDEAAAAIGRKRNVSVGETVGLKKANSKNTRRPR